MAPPPAVLPIFRTVSEALTLMVENWRTFVRVATVPFCVFVLAQGVLRYTLDVPTTEQENPLADPTFVSQLMARLVVDMAVELVAVLPLLTRWIRVGVEGPGVLSATGDSGYGMAESAVLGRMIQLGLIMAVVTLFLVALTGALLSPSGTPQMMTLAFWGTVVASYFVARFAFVLVKASGVEETSLSWSWKATEGNGVRLLGAILLILFPVLMAIGVVTQVLVGLGLEGAGAPGGISALVRGALFVVEYGLIASVLAVAYRRLTGPGARGTDLTV